MRLWVKSAFQNVIWATNIITRPSQHKLAIGMLDVKNSGVDRWRMFSFLLFLNKLIAYYLQIELFYQNFIDYDFIFHRSWHGRFQFNISRWFVSWNVRFCPLHPSYGTRYLWEYCNKPYSFNPCGRILDSYCNVLFTGIVFIFSEKFEANVYWAHLLPFLLLPAPCLTFPSHISVKRWKSTNTHLHLRSTSK